MKKYTTSIIVFLIFVSLFSACKKNPQNTYGPSGTVKNSASPSASISSTLTATLPATSSPENTGVPIQQEIRPDFASSIFYEPSSFDPAVLRDMEIATLMVLMYEGLTTVDKDLQVRPGMAKDWVISPDGLKYTFNLRDAVWSDGKPVTAEDFVFSWRRAVSAELNADYAFELFQIANAKEINSGSKSPSELGVRAIDSKTLEVTLKEPNVTFLKVAGFPTLFPVRSDVIAANPDSWAKDPAVMVVNGAFSLNKLDHPNILFTKNDKYWDKENIKANAINFKVSIEPRYVSSYFKEGVIQFGNLVNYEDREYFKNEGTLYTKPLLHTSMMVINNTKSPFNDVRVRKALSLAIDREYISGNVGDGPVEAAGALVPTGIQDIAVGSDFRGSGNKYYGLGGSDMAGNISQATQLLSDAGYAGGVNFPTIRLLISDRSLADHAAAEYMQQMWKSILGIETKISVAEMPQFSQMRKSGDFDIVKLGWEGDYIDPLTFLEIWATGNPDNYAGYKNPAYDALISSARSVADPSTRIKTLHDAEDMLIGRDMVVIPLYFYKDIFTMSKSLHDVVYSPMGFKYFNWAYMD